MNERLSGPVFQAHFADGDITRMSVNTSLTHLDLWRALKVSVAAYESRWRHRKPAIPTPPIIAGHFCLGDEILRDYTLDEVREATAATAD